MHRSTISQVDAGLDYWVQWLWATIVRDHLAGPDARRLVPERPPSRPGLLEFYQRASLNLQEVLGASKVRPTSAV